MTIFLSKKIGSTEEKKKGY